MAGLWDYQARVSRRAVRDARGGWVRRAVFEGVPAEQAERLLPADHSTYPGHSGTDAPILMRADVEPDWRPGTTAADGLARVTLEYRAPTYDDWQEAHPNKAILVPAAALRSERVREHDGQVLEGPDPDDETGQTRWQRESGSNVIFRHEAAYELRYVTDNRTLYVFPFISKVGHYNKSPLLRLPLSPEPSTAGQWLLAEVACSPRAGHRRLWDCRLLLQLNLSGWDEVFTARKWQLSVTEIAVQDDAGEETGETRYVAAWQPTDETADVEMTQAAEFVLMDQMLINSW